jgi:nucleoside-diphosphate-sugar epimerase
MSRVIALTGATGFIGGVLAQRLEAEGWQVRALVRLSSVKARLAGIVTQRVIGDIEDIDSLRRLVCGAEAVVHCAGAVRGASQDYFNRVNSAGVARLAQAATEHYPPPRFLMISSLVAREPGISPYAASKRQGEAALAATAKEMEWTVLRPPAVYGPGDKELLPLLRWIGRGIALVPGAGHARRFSLLYVEDLAEAVIRWLKSDGCGGDVFELHDDRSGGYTWSDVIKTIALLRARPVLRVRVPVTVLAALTRLNLMAARMVGYAPMLTPGKLRELMHPDWVCDNTPFSKATGWKPQIPLEEGLLRTLGWHDEP